MKRWLLFPLIALSVAILHLQIFSSTWGDRLEPLALDVWFNIRGPVAPPDDVVVIAMDESSYDALGVPMDKAWPRALHAKLLERLKEYGARRIAMDILFLGESSDKSADEALSNALGLTPTVIGADSGIKEVASTAGRFTMEELLQPPEIFSGKAERIALARLPDDFGAVRRFTVPRTNATRDIPSLFEAATGVAKLGAIENTPGPRDFLWYYGPPLTIPTYPLHQVLNTKGALPPATFKDKTVFVGLSLRTELGPSQKDSYRTPFYERGSMFGVEIQATATANLLSHQWIRRAPALTEGIAIFVVTFLLCALVFSLRPQWAGVVVVLFSLTWAISAYLLFLNGYFVPGVILVCIVLPLSYLGSTLAYYLVTHRSQQQVEKAFQMYLSPDMAKQMRSNPGSLSLGGESMYATALFSDIEGFTSITEGMSASEVSAMLNAYFTEVMNTVIDNKGTLIKFIGDAVFALWGAPIKHADHAKLACETAVAMQREVEKFNASKRFPPLHTRVGINTGTMVVGNLGSAKRFDYTAIGDSVNLASRLEGINKYFGTKILLSDAVRKESGGKIKTVSLGAIVVAGKTEAVEIFTIFNNPIAVETEAKWNKALNKFRLRSFAEAETLLQEAALEESQLSGPSKIYLEAISRFANIPPSDEWRGEISFTHK